MVDFTSTKKFARNGGGGVWTEYLSKCPLPTFASKQLGIKVGGGGGGGIFLGAYTITYSRTQGTASNT